MTPPDQEHQGARRCYSLLQRAWRQQAKLCRMRTKRSRANNYREADALTVRINANAARVRAVLIPVILSNPHV